MTVIRPSFLCRGQESGLVPRFVLTKGIENDRDTEKSLGKKVLVMIKETNKPTSTYSSQSYNEERNQETGVTELTTETFLPNQCEQTESERRRLRIFSTSFRCDTSCSALWRLCRASLIIRSMWACLSMRSVDV